MSSSPEKNAELMTTTKEIRIVAVKWSGGSTFTSRAGSLLVRPVGSYFDSSRTPSTDDDDDHGLLCLKEKRHSPHFFTFLGECVTEVELINSGRCKRSSPCIKYMGHYPLRKNVAQLKST